ncbi:MAG: hypothetical protein FJ044_03760 [Candidatus Cloacimonetes bacterium]|nr:hypothetical protein [Candidatus Cloacimonadota bacterium]
MSKQQEAVIINLKSFATPAATLLVGIFFITGIAVGTLFLGQTEFYTLSPQRMQARIIKERNFAIRKAVEAGVYKCCITPPCTMCYMEANPWNNQTPGTCDCDNLIAQGQEPCPQCVVGLCEKSADGTCEVSGNQK